MSKYAFELPRIPNYKYLFIQKLYDALPEGEKFPVTDFLKIVDEIPVERLRDRECAFTDLMVKALVAAGHSEAVDKTIVEARIVTVRMTNHLERFDSALHAMIVQYEKLTEVTTSADFDEGLDQFKTIAKKLGE